MEWKTTYAFVECFAFADEDDIAFDEVCIQRLDDGQGNIPVSARLVFAILLQAMDNEASDHHAPFKGRRTEARHLREYENK